MPIPIPGRSTSVYFDLLTQRLVDDLVHRLDKRSVSALIRDLIWEKNAALAQPLEKGDGPHLLERRPARLPDPASPAHPRSTLPRGDL